MLPSDESEDEFVCFREGRQNPRLLDDTDTDLSFRYSADQLAEAFGMPSEWHNPGLSVKVYIDDINNIEKVCHLNAVSNISQGRRRILAHAQHCEDNFLAVKRRAASIKMSVNDKKTQLVCISGNLDNDINTYIRTDADTEITGGDSLKLLGFWFGRRPNGDLHVQKMAAKFRARLWALRHLKKSSMSQQDLKTVYTTVLRAVLDYASPTYHPLLTGQQTVLLESLQKRAAKIIFGFNTSYAAVIEEGHLEPLESRRRTLCLNFARKAAANARFAHWFPARTLPEYGLRNPNKYQEEKPRTERMKRDPVYYMRHELNKL